MARGKTKVLIIDADKAFAEKIAEILNPKGFNTTLCHTGKDGIHKASYTSPDIVLINYQIPDLKSKEVLNRLKGIDRTIPVIIVMAVGGERATVDLLKAGASDFLVKPIRSRDLLEAIKRAQTKRMADLEIQSKKFLSLGKLFPLLAHEIRNPLHAIGGALAVLQRRCDLKDDTITQSIEIIREEVQRLNQFIQECLDFSRPPARRRFAETDLNEIIRSSLNTLAPIIEADPGKIEVITHLDDDLPKIKANFNEIKQVCLNILKNAIEAIKMGGKLEIRTSSNPHKRPRYVMIKIVDTGTGIDKENLPYLFDPFFSTKSRGTGLGLAICKKIVVENHRGQIDIKSNTNIGTTVTITFPFSP
ncbi:MAG: response regulator [Syntrophobacterales bacterium]|nr:MAG: response regulator [Syntrophobacterales bacterium]